MLKTINTKKGFGSVASTLIMFIAIMIVSTALVIAIKNYASTTQDSIYYQNKITSNKLRTAIDISNVFYNSTTTTTYIYVKNIGETKLATEQFDVFIDNVYITNYSTYYASNLSKPMTILGSGQTGVFVKTKALSVGTHEVKVVSEFGGPGANEYFNN